MIEYQHDPVKVTHNISRSNYPNGSIVINVSGRKHLCSYLREVVAIGRREKITEVEVFFSDNYSQTMPLSSELISHLDSKNKGFVFPKGFELVIAFKEIFIPNEIVLVSTEKGTARISAVPTDSYFVVKLSNDDGFWCFRRTPDVTAWVSHQLTSHGIHAVSIPLQYNNFSNVPLIEDSTYRTIFQIN